MSLSFVPSFAVMRSGNAESFTPLRFRKSRMAARVSAVNLPSAARQAAFWKSATSLSCSPFSKRPMRTGSPGGREARRFLQTRDPALLQPLLEEAEADGVARRLRAAARAGIEDVSQLRPV